MHRFKKPLSKTLAVFSLGLCLGTVAPFMMPTQTADAAPELGSWKKYYGQVCSRQQVGYTKTECNGNTWGWGQVTNDIESGNHGCP